MKIESILNKTKKVQEQMTKAKEQNDDDLVTDLKLELDELEDDLRFAYAEDEKVELERYCN